MASSVAGAASPPAFPGALGFGANATGGRGGSVYHVTTLADSGAGSFRDAVSSSRRIIVFDVGGYITLSSSVGVKSSITIAGQTAPGGGIGIKGAEVSFGGSSNIICRHVRFRPGNAAPNGDNGINLYNATNIILDHVSIEFANWNNIDAVNCDLITVQNSLIADPIYQQFGAHTEHLSSSFSWYYNLFANAHNRQPLAKINTIFVNNVVYNYQAAYTVANTSGHFSHDILNNYFICGPATSSAGNDFYQMNANQSIYAAGNLRDSNKDGALNGSTTTPGGGGIALTSPWSPLTTNATIYTAAGAYRLDVSLAGAFPRDPMDSLVLSQVQTLGSGSAGTGSGTAGPSGSLYTSETQTGLPNNGFGTINGGPVQLDSDGDGMPDYWEMFQGLNPNNANDRTNLTASGYTRLEEYLNWLAQPHAITTTNTAVDIDLRQYTLGFAANALYFVGGASNGTVTLFNGSTAHFVPNSSFSGLGSFVFSVNDGVLLTNTVSIAVSSLAPPAELTWRGDGTANLWNTSSTNWLNGTNASGFKGGDTVTFDDSGSNTPAITLSGSLAPAAVTVAADQDYTFSGTGSLSGSMALEKNGRGTLTLNTTNAYSGGTVVSGGTLALGTTTTAGSGTMTLDGGTLSLTASGGPATYNNAVLVGSPSTLVTPGSGNYNQALGGTLSGSADLSLNIGSGGTFSARGDMSAYSGTILLSGNGTFRWYGSTGSSLADFALGSGNATMTTRDGGTISLGSLAGGPGTSLKGAGSTATLTTYVVGGNNANTVFSGTIANGTVSGSSVATALTKTGSGTLTLAGTNSYTGATAVNAGTLAVNGNNGPSAVTVASGAMLNGNGSLGGLLTVNSGGRFAPGVGVGTLTLSNGLTLNSANLYFDLANVTMPGGGVNDLVALKGGALTLSGTSTVYPNLLNDSLPNGAYTLISGGSATTGSAANLAWGGPNGGRQTFSFSTSSPGTVLLNVGGSPAATLGWRGTESSTWDSSATNWLNGSTPDRFYPFDLTMFDDSALNGSVSLAGTLQPSQVLVTNSLLDYTFTGSGTLSGPAQLVKGGAGTLTVSTNNAYSGGTMLYGGTVVMGSLGALGPAPITLSGGALTFAAGNFSNNIVVVGSGTVNGNSLSHVYLKTPILGSGNLTANVPGGRLLTEEADGQGFSGTLRLNGPGTFRFNQGSYTWGNPNANFSLAGSSILRNRSLADVSIYLGGLSGDAGTSLLGSDQTNNPGAVDTYIIGALNQDGTFAGLISDGVTHVTALQKVGSGTWTLTGANSYSGDTTVSAGTLQVNNSGGSATGSGDVEIMNGATLSGSGSIGGSVTCDDGATLSPGGPTGALRVGGDLVLNGLTALQFSLGSNSAPVVVGGAFSAAGILNVFQAGGFGAGYYVLFSYNSTNQLDFGGLALGSLPGGYRYAVSTNVPGQVALVVTEPNAAPAGFGAVSATAGMLTMSCTGGIPNAPFYLLGSTNIGLPMRQWTRLATNQFDALGRFTFTNAVPNGSAGQFYRLQLP